MDFQILVGRSFTETELYELLLFELEDNFTKHLGINLHIYFERLGNSRIKVVEFVRFEDDGEMIKVSRSLLEKREWLEIEGNYGILNLLLCRFDRTGWLSSIQSEGIVHTQPWCESAVGERSVSAPMTGDRICLAFRELAGFLKGHQDLKNLKFKKTI
jgi:hypothetical protein